MSTSRDIQPAESNLDIDLSGRTLGGYQVLRRLGRGAMAEVYLAEQGSLRRKVAFKVLKPQLATDATYVKRFHNEAQAAASLVHANIVQIHEVGCIDGVHFIAQEYVEGKNLKQYIVQHGTVDAALAVAIIRQVASALHRAGQEGIVHRDIKPENIMLARAGEVKVTDFGLARVTTGDAAVNLTQVGITMGTPLYMSPEQVEGKPLDPRSDLYSLGVTCYHMLAGMPPFRGDTALSIAVQHLNSRADRLESCRPDLPAGLCRVVHRMLEKKIQDRFNSAHDMLRELRALRIEDPDAPWPDDLGAAMSETWSAVGARTEATQKLSAVMKSSTVPRWRRRRALLMAASVLAAVVIGGAIAANTREAFLLKGADPAHSHLAKQPTVLEQMFAASAVGTEDAWLSVLEHYPDKEHEYYLRRAKQQLARIYLRGDRLDEAKQLFDQFANLSPDENVGFRVFGLAGQCVVFSLQGEHEKSAKILAELWPDRDRLDVQMAAMVQSAARRNREQLDVVYDPQIERWLTAPPEEEGGG